MRAILTIVITFRKMSYFIEYIVIWQIGFLSLTLVLAYPKEIVCLFAFILFTLFIFKIQ